MEPSKPPSLHKYILPIIGCMVVLVFVGFVGLRAYKVYASSQHVCPQASRTQILSERLETNQLSSSLEVKSGLTYWLNGVGLNQSTDEIFGSLQFPQILYFPANHTLDGNQSDTGQISLYKPKNWYRFSENSGSWKFYTSGNKQDTLSLTIVACKQQKFF